MCKEGVRILTARAHTLPSVFQATVGLHDET